MKFLPIICFLFFSLSMFAGLAGAQEITVLTTTWTPYAYEENGQMAGMGTEIVRAVLNDAGIDAQIKRYPWKRAILTARKEKDVLIYPLIRIREREHDFIWVAPIFKARLSLFRLKKKTGIKISSLADGKKYTIGVLRGAAMHQYLLAHGFEDHKQLKINNTNRRSVELLFLDRVDLCAENPLVFKDEAAKLGYSMNDAEEVFVLFENDAYMAFGRGSQTGYVERLRRSIEHLRTAGNIAAIVNQYH